MAAQFAAPDRLSDDEMTQGFSFHVRQANRQGQFSGSVPKNIIPEVQLGNAVLNSGNGIKPSAPRVPFEFSTLAGFQGENPHIPSDHDDLPHTDRHTEQSREDNTRASTSLSPPDNAAEERQSSHESNHDVNFIETSPKVSGQFFNDSLPVIDASLNAIVLQRPPSRILSRGAIPSPDASNSPGHGRQASAKVSPIQLESIRANNHPPAQPPVQRCGDLEDYGYSAASEVVRTPPSHRFTRQRQTAASYSALDSSITRRSNSRTSNMSRKRPFAALNYHAVEPDRKRFAMDQAVKHWNECIQITTEESHKANSVISYLKKKIQRRENELQAVKKALQTGQGSLQELQNQYEELKARDEQVGQEKQNLELQCQDLGANYHKLQDQFAAVSKKYDICQEKLDGTVSEHQKLVDQAKEDRLLLEKRLQDGDKQGKESVSALECTLKVAEADRETLRDMIRQMQLNSEHQTLKHDHEIALLSKDVELANARAAALKQEKNDIITKEASNNNTLEAINDIHTKLDKFATEVRAFEQGQALTTMEIASVDSKMHNLPDKSAVAEVDNHVLECYGKIRDLEALVQSNCLPQIESLGSSHLDIQHMLKSLTEAVAIGFTKLQGEIHNGAVGLSGRISKQESAQTQIMDHLSLLSVSHKDISSRLEATNSHLENICSAVADDSHIAVGVANILDESKKPPYDDEKLRDVQKELQEFAQSKHAVLLEQIDTKFSNQNNMISQLATNLKDYLASTMDMGQQKVTVVHMESASQTEFVEPSSETVQTIRDLVDVRSKLDFVESQLSKVGDVSSSLQQIHDLSILLQETSTYMEQEQHWVQEQLSKQELPLASPSSDNDSAIKVSNSQSSEQLNLRPDSGYVTTAHNPQTTLVRKVTVQSPGPRSDSPLPVTTFHEQRRRRESAPPRSILKPQNKVCATDERLKAGRGNYGTAEEAVAEIRSILVDSPSKNRRMGLTSMADYMKSSRISAMRQTTVQIGDLADVGNGGQVAPSTAPSTDA